MIAERRVTVEVSWSPSRTTAKPGTTIASCATENQVPLTDEVVQVRLVERAWLSHLSALVVDYGAGGCGGPYQFQPLNSSRSSPVSWPFGRQDKLATLRSKTLAPFTYEVFSRRPAKGRTESPWCARRRPKAINPERRGWLEPCLVHCGPFGRWFTMLSEVEAYLGSHQRLEGGPTPWKRGDEQEERAGSCAARWDLVSSPQPWGFAPGLGR